MKTKTAVVYDKWLDSLGGGEVVACHIARFLIEKGYKVDFVSGKKVSSEVIKNRLGIDISKANFVQIWNDEFELHKFTSGKDIFVNTTFMDYSCGNAKKNYYYCHFPTPEYTGPKSYIYNKVFLPIFYKLVRPKELTQSDAPTTFINAKISYSINDKNEICFYNLTKGSNYNISTFIYLETFSKLALEKIIQKVYGGTVNSIKKIVYHHSNELEYRQKIKSNTNSIKISFYLPYEISPAYVINSEIQNPLFPSRLNLFRTRLEIRLRAGYFKNISTRMKSFDKVIANSNFTSYWIKRYWKTKSITIYPPVDFIQKANKAKYICSVGRFFTRGHGKKQEILIQAFKQMCDNGLKGWELHLAGGLSADEESKSQYNKLVKSIEKYPIRIHINQPREYIEKLLGKSTIYWHAAGFGENSNKYPIKMEHFGISTVEAISAGCIPVVYANGGLPEIIKNCYPQQESIHLYSSIQQLADKTLEIISGLSKDTDKYSPKNLETFSKKHFYDLLNEHITS